MTAEFSSLRTSDPDGPGAGPEGADGHEDGAGRPENPGTTQRDDRRIVGGSQRFARRHAIGTAELKDPSAVVSSVDEWPL